MGGRRLRGLRYGIVVFSFSRTFWLSAVLLVPVGFSVMIQMASSNTLIQSMVPGPAARARDVGLCNDFYGHGSLGCFARR